MAVVKNLMVRAGADFSALSKATNQAQKSMNQLQKETSKSMSGFQNIISGTMGKVAGILGTIGATMYIKNAVKDASDLRSALVGLNSVVTGNGLDISRANKFIQSYVKDGLVPLTNAVTSYKNLAARGYNSEQIEQTMTRLKDSAAFGRQASLTMGEAISGATEGLKNENSILVDNAGVTKNVSKMWEDYAKSIGKTRDELTQQEKIQAEVNGIMTETRFQVGDAAKYSQEYAGKMSALKKSFFDLSVNIGNIFIPIIMAVVPIVFSVVTKISNLASIAARFMKALFGGGKDDHKKSTVAAAAQAKAVGGVSAAYDKAGKAAKNASKSVAGFDEINSLSSSSGGKDDSTGSGGGASNVPAIDLGLGETNTALGETQGKIEEFANKVKEFWQNISDFAMYHKTLFVGVWTEIKDTLTNIATDTWNILKSVWEENGKGIIDGLKGFWESIKSICLTFWESFLKPVIGTFLDIFNRLWEDHLKALVAEVAEFVAKLVSFALAIWNNVISPIVKFLIEILGPVFTVVFGAISGVVAGLIGTVAGVFTGIFKILNGLIDFITGVFTGNWKKAWEGVKEVVVGIFKYFGNLILLPINVIIEGINGAIAGFNKIKIPDWIPGIGGKGLSIPYIPKIPMLANGGITNGPTMAIIGDNPGGQEVVSPLDKLTGIVTNAVVQAMQFTQSSNNNSQSGDVVLNLDGKTLARVLRRYTQQESNRSGMNVRIQPI